MVAQGLKSPSFQSLNLSRELFNFAIVLYRVWSRHSSLAVHYKSTNVKIDATVWPRHRIEKKDRTVKKSHKVVAYLRRSPHCTDWNQNLQGEKFTTNIITCANFLSEIFWRYDFYRGGGGVEFSIFLLIFACVLQQFSSTATATPGSNCFIILPSAHIYPFNDGIPLHDKKLIRRWDSERELSLRRHRARTTKYNRLVHNAATDRRGSPVMCWNACVYQIQWNNAI